MIKKKFVLEFDDTPALLFVSHDGRHDEFYVNGEKVEHITELDIRSAVDEFTSYNLSAFGLKTRKEPVND